MRPWALAWPVLRRMRAGWPVLLAAFLVLLTSVTLIAAGVVYGDAVAVGGVQRALRDAPPAGAAMLVTSAVRPADLRATDAVARGELHAAMAPTDGDVSLIVAAGPFVRDGAAAGDAPLLRFAAVESIEDHAALVDGAWPVAGATPVEVTLSQGAAAALGVATGDRLLLRPRQPDALPLEVAITGTWRADPADPFWFDDALLLTGTRTEGSFTTVGPLVVTLDDLLARAAVPQLDIAWRAFPAMDRLAADEVDALAASVATADERLRAALPPPPAITVTTDLPAILAAVSTSVTVSRAGVLVLTLEFAVLASYAIVMVGGMLADRRRGEVALLRSRGATTGALLTFSLLEATVLTIPAIMLAPFLAVGLVRLVGDVGPLAGSGALADPRVTGAVIVAALLAGVGCLVALAAPAVISASGPAGERAATARPTGRGLAGRLGMDLVLVALAAVGLWQLRLYGAPLTRDARGTLGVDPLLIAAPALTLLAGALVGTRLLPRIAELASPLAGRARGPVAPLTTWGLARRPQRATRSALLLMLAAALGTFAAVYQATWSRSQADQATQQAGADVRTVMSDYPALPDWAVGPALRAVPGVSAAAGVGVRSLDSGRVIRNGTLIATQADDLDAAMAGMDTDAVTGLPAVARTLAEQRGPAPGAVIPAGAALLGVTLDGLRASDLAGVPVAVPASRVEVVAVVANSDGVHRLPLGAVPVTPGPQRVAGLLGGPTAAGPLSIALPARLLALEVIVSAGAGELVTGSLGISTPTTSSVDGSGAAPLAVDPADDGWSWRVLGTGGRAQPVGSDDGRVGIAADEPGALPPIMGSPEPPTTLRLQAASVPPSTIAAVASDAFLAASGARVGDAVSATVSGLPVTLRIVGSVPAVPSRDALDPVVVVDAPTLADLELLTIGRLAPAREWWLGTTPIGAGGAGPETAADVAAVVATAPFEATTVVGRDTLARTLLADPVALGVIGALTLGSLAALAMAAVGFVLSATVSAAERLGEFAVLRALGLTGRALSGWLLLESAILLGFGLVGGIVLGLVLSWLVLPFASLTQTGEPPVPPASLVVPWETILSVAAAGGLVLLAATLLATRRVPGVGLGGVLRAKAGS